MESSQYQDNSFDISKKFKRDIEYIKADVLSRQIDGNLCKWSRALNAVAIIGLTEKQFYDYWYKQYKDFPEYLDEIMLACREKLENDLLPRDTMMQMIADSHDFETEKEKAIKALGGRYISEKRGK